MIPPKTVAPTALRTFLFSKPLVSTIIKAPMPITTRMYMGIPKTGLRSQRTASK